MPIDYEAMKRQARVGDRAHGGKAVLVEAMTLAAKMGKMP